MAATASSEAKAGEQLGAHDPPRWGSRVNVTIAVRWLHSLVISMMPSTGSRKPLRRVAITPM